MKKDSIEIIKNFKIQLDDKLILRCIGHKSKESEVNSSIKQAITEEKERLSSFIHPTALYTIIPYEETNQHSIFKDAAKVALCICTIGPELEKEVAKLMAKNELLRGLILDALGSEAVESIAQQMDDILVKKARFMNLWPSKRYSPGYKSWGLEGQKFIFQKLPAEKIGVSLTESIMMVPRKSISFRINFYADKTFISRNRNL